MSNQVVIQRHEVKNSDTGEKWKEVNIFDDYGDLGTIPMGSMPENDLALFSKLVQEQINYCYIGIDRILQYLYDTKSGITIAGKYYDYESIEPTLKYYVGSE